MTSLTTGSAGSLPRACGKPGSNAGTDLRLFEWAERLAYALADRIVFTNPSQMEMMLGYCDDPRLVERVRSIAEISSHPVLPRRLLRPGPQPLDAPARERSTSPTSASSTPPATSGTW